MKEKRKVDIDELREELGFAERCENCKQNVVKCMNNCSFSIHDFCDMFDIAIEAILARHPDDK